jgi:hypothetical protein
MTFNSQAGQDRLVHALHPTPGYFVDIGAAGLSISNTLVLEQLDWKGVLIDNSPEAKKVSELRSVPFLFADATRLDYSFLPEVVDYLSLDIDGASLSALFQLPLGRTRFRIITMEHDFYERGESLRSPMLSVLKNHGYDVLCADVCHEGKSFEIWAIDPNAVDMTVADTFRRDKPTDWREILGH